MPNWVMNHLEITGEEAELARFREFVAGPVPEDVEEGSSEEWGDSRFDFNKIKPMPAILDGTISPVPVIGVAPWPAYEDPENMLKSIPATEEQIAEMERVGAFDWHTWRVNEWGTKWSAACVCVEVGVCPPSLIYEFETAWCVPYGIYEKLVEEFPTLRFDLHVADPMDGATWRFRWEGVFSAAVEEPPARSYWPPKPWTDKSVFGWTEKKEDK